MIGNAAQARAAAKAAATAAPSAIAGSRTMANNNSGISAAPPGSSFRPSDLAGE